ncbi:MAG: TlpA disulfide reductase family protein [Saprospiraceae bacterium]|nr:TlpA disulfide reductase family protein [Saprospiraceae bacterium]
MIIRCLFFLFLVNSGWAQTQPGDFEVVDFQTFEKKYLAEVDQPVVYNFWATWCKPCVKEMPYFLEASEKHPEWNFVLVSLDFPMHFESKLRPFLIKNQIEIPVVVLDETDANVYIDKIDPSWQGSIPATLVWKNKNIGFIEDEFDSYGELEEYLTQTIKTHQ